MAENITIARPYASAVFELAREENSLGEWSDMLNVLNLVISDVQLEPVLDNPRFDADALAGIILDICDGYLSDQGKNFVSSLIDAGRLNLIPHIYRLFEQNRTEAEGVVNVEVESAYALEQSEQDRIAEAMGKRLDRKININVRINESLIGGAIIRAGDSVIDASVKGRLKQLGSDLID